MDAPFRRKIVIGVVCAVVLLGGIALSQHVQFVTGGALVNAGYRMQDHIHSFDLRHHDEITPTEVWNEVIKQNHLAAAVRKRFPRSSHHPLVAMVVCMDARIDTNELTGDTRKYYYIIRTAGSVLSEKEEEMLELAVANGVKVIVWTTHTDCAAEKTAADPARANEYPHLVAAVNQRHQRLQEFLARPRIAAKVASGELLVKRMAIETETEELR